MSPVSVCAEPPSLLHPHSRLPFWTLYKLISVLSKVGSLNSLTGNHISCIQGGLYSLPQKFTGWVTTYWFLTAGQLNLQSELIKFLHLQTAANQPVSLALRFDTVLVCTTQLVLFSLRSCWQLPERERASQQLFSSLIRETSPSYQLLWFWLIAAPFPAHLLWCLLCSLPECFALRSTSLDFPGLIFFAFGVNAAALSASW